MLLRKWRLRRKLFFMQLPVRATITLARRCCDMELSHISARQMVSQPCTTRCREGELSTAAPICDNRFGLRKCVSIRRCDKQCSLGSLGLQTSFECAVFTHPALRRSFAMQHMMNLLTRQQLTCWHCMGTLWSVLLCGFSNQLFPPPLADICVSFTGRFPQKRFLREQDLFVLVVASCLRSHSWCYKYDAKLNQYHCWYSPQTMRWSSVIFSPRAAQDRSANSFRTAAVRSRWLAKKNCRAYHPVLAGCVGMIQSRGYSTGSDSLRLLWAAMVRMLSSRVLSCGSHPPRAVAAPRHLAAVSGVNLVPLGQNFLQHQVSKVFPMYLTNLTYVGLYSRGLS